MLWPFTVDILEKFVAFVKSLHWPVDGSELGNHGVSHVEMLILFEHCTRHKLFSDNVIRPHKRPVGLLAQPSCVLYLKAYLSGKDADVLIACRVAYPTPLAASKD